MKIHSNQSINNNNFTLNKTKIIDFLIVGWMDNHIIIITKDHDDDDEQKKNGNKYKYERR